MKLWDGFCWRVAKRRSDRNRKEFFDLLYSGAFEAPQPLSDSVLPLQVVSFSGKRDVGEQVLSMWSFLRWVGKPLVWHLYHDGTLEAEDISLLRKAFPGLQVESWAVALPRLEPSLDFLKGYADWHAMGKRMIAYSTHPVTTPTLFIDSDIVFYAKARAALEKVLASGHGAFMEDGKWGSFDTRYLAQNPTPTTPVNGGFLLVQPGFQWREIWDYIRSLNGTYEYFSDQTAFHLSFPKQGALPLDAKEFVVQWTDQFKIGSDFPAGRVAVRHFVNMVRHKMWETGWRWHLQGGPGGNQETPGIIHRFLGKFRRLLLKVSSQCVACFTRWSGLKDFRGHHVFEPALTTQSEVWDLGANLGDFSTFITKHIGCRCLALEPSPQNFQAIPDLPGLEKKPAAIGAKAGEATFFISSNSEACSLFSQVSANDGVIGQTKVQVDTFATLRAHREGRIPDLVKFDIEGAELEVLRSLTDEELLSVPQWTVEFHDFIEGSGMGPDVLEAKARFKRLGFVEVVALAPLNVDCLFLQPARCNLSTRNKVCLWLLRGIFLPLNSLLISQGGKRL